MFQSTPILLGQYRPLDSFLHRLDARAKIVPITLVLILALLTDSLIFYLTVLVSLLGGLLLSGVGKKTLTNNFKPVLVLVAITFLYHLLFSAKDTAVVAELLGIRITSGAIDMAVFYSLRLVIFISVAFLVTLTNSPSELGDAMTKMLGPLRKLRVPVYDLALILFIALRFIPILYEEFTAIKNAQIIRGVSFAGPIVNRIRKTTSIIIPVFVAAIQRADELALAIEARGYTSGYKRTFYSRSRFGPREWLFAVVSSAMIVALFYITR
ncbi:MAG: energy-coupling factor transporter transmembrane protein EcfT [Candidatus Zixiibacteriota bacterium]|nr:MAG: energy-coupling factor transporter transmembrane protein EcfT [candidate division Zixibacteria bacterium]